MKTLLACILFAGAASLAAWQEHFIHRAQASISELAGKIVNLREDIQIQENSLAEKRHQLKKLQAVVRSQASPIAADDTFLPTPAQEGWWPTNRSYFYMRKSLLPMSRFRSHQMTDDEMTPETKKFIEAEGVGSPIAEITLFQGDELNPLAGSLLGMTTEELSSTGEIYANLRRDIRNIEAARLQRVDPPESINDGQVVIARLPALTEEVQPLLDHCNRLLTDTLGAERSEILRSHAEIFFNEHEDGLGSVPREFIRRRSSSPGSGILARYIDQWGNKSVSQWSCSNGTTWQYGHLFGPDTDGSSW